VKEGHQQYAFMEAGRQNGNAVAVYFNLPVTFVNTEEE
jgi:hypothetical protein